MGRLPSLAANANVSGPQGHPRRFSQIMTCMLPASAAWEHDIASHGYCASADQPDHVSRDDDSI